MDVNAQCLSHTWFSRSNTNTQYKYVRSIVSYICYYNSTNLYSNLRYPNRFRRALLLFCNPMITESLDMTISLASTERETWKLFFVLLRLEIKTEILSWPSQWVSLICCTMNLETLPRLHGKSKYTIWSIKVILEIIILYFIDWIR